MIFASYKTSDPIIQEKPNLWRNYNAVNTASLMSDLRHSTLDGIFECTDTEDMVNICNDVLVRLLNTHAPLKPFIRKTGINSTNVWYTEEISIAAANRDLAKRNYKANKTPANLKEYHKQRNIATQLAKNAKSAFQRPRLNCDIGVYQVWKNAKDLGLVSSRKNTVAPAFTADEFNEHTTYRAPTTENRNINLQPVNHQMPQHTSTQVNANRPFAFRNVSELEVYEAVGCVESKATGLDEIPLPFIKLILVEILPHITHIINSCIMTSKCPNIWKKAKVFPNHKRSKTFNLDDFRAINILPIFSKVFEILLKNQIMEHLSINKLLAVRQSGFRTSHSTTTALLKISDDIKRVLEKKRTAVLLLLDFTKAFDSVVHELLCAKLQSQFFFDTSAVSLISDYLSGRVQAVCIDGIMSDFLPVTRGIPQGSVLGPVLFLLFINDMPGSIKYMLTHLFADDVQLYKVFLNSDLVKSIKEINLDMLSVNKWAITNKLELNAKKSQGIVVCNGSVDYSPLVKLNGVSIPFYAKVKNLGLIINNNFKWLDHAESIHNRVFAGLRSLWPFTNSTPIGTRKMLARSLLMPYFEYCSSVFSYGLDYSAKTLLNSAFNAVVKYVYGLKRHDDVEPYAIRFIGYSLQNFFKFRDMSFLYKLIHTKSPLYLRELITIDHTTRTKQAEILRCNNMRRNTLFGKGIVDWNLLPAALRYSGTHELFCKRYFQHTR